MGKGDEERPPDPSHDPPDSSSSSSAAARCSRRCCRFVRPRCVFVVLLGLAALVSAMFWLPVFVRRSKDLDLSDEADIIASFRLQRTVSQLNQNISKLESDIFDEIGFPNSTVTISSLNPIPNSNYTTIKFSIFPYPINSTISETWLSIIRSSFLSLTVNQWSLDLDPVLFGNSSYFQILKFPNGITVIPPQNAFLLQKPHAVFNFSLNFPICVVKERVEDLKDQMRQGLLLTSYENLYVKLTNLAGSTMDPPTIVQTSIILSIGATKPGLNRLKQLAQTIRNSSSGSNLGLNHTVFGRVKQIRLSSFLQHSLNTGSASPAPAPNPNYNPIYRHHHHHHNHDNDGNNNNNRNNNQHLSPVSAPPYTPPQNPNPNRHHHHHHHHNHHHHHSNSNNNNNNNNNNNHNNNNNNDNNNKKKHMGPVNAPPKYRDISPGPSYKHGMVPSSSPVRGVVLGNAQPPSQNGNNNNRLIPPQLAPLQSPAPSPSSGWSWKVDSTLCCITLLLNLILLSGTFL